MFFCIYMFPRASERAPSWKYLTPCTGGDSIRDLESTSHPLKECTGGDSIRDLESTSHPLKEPCKEWELDYQPMIL
jgi:hypothetical protein